MQLYPVPASEWTTFTKNNQAVLTFAGGIPVNDILKPLWDEYAKIRLLYGGRGGGKSEGVFDKLISQCLNDKYFNCYYGRKIWDTIHKSCFETIVNSIEKQGLQDKFTYSKADNSSMVIRCKASGNKFVPFGADKPEKLKSIKDPSHIVCEEFDQFTFFDFQELYPTLRTTKAKCEFIGMFNTKEVFPDHWIIMIFFPEKYSGREKIQFDAMEGVTVQKIFINYYHNHFINQAEYYQQLRLASGGNQFLLDSIANGAWGVRENGNPWLHSFRDLGSDRTHIRPLPLMQSEPVYLTFDINAEPLSCTAWQRSARMGLWTHCIREFGGHIKVDDICSQIRAAFPKSILFVTGDRSGQNQDVGRNQTIYQMIQAHLGLSDKQMNLNTHNLEHADSRLLCNTIFEHYPIFIDPSCVNLIADCRKATVDMDSVRGNQLLKDRGEYKMDYFDGMRYYFQTYFLQYIRDNYLILNKKRNGKG